MKDRTIVKILTGKFIDWTKSIDDIAVRKLVEDNTIITGGAIVSMFLNEEVNDFDIYFRDANTAFAVAQYYVKKLKENPPKAFDAQKNEIKAILEPATEDMVVGEGEIGMVVRCKPARVRIVINSKNLRGEEMRQNQKDSERDYQYVEGQVGDDTEPGATYEGNVEELDEIPATAVTKDNSKGKDGKYRVMFMTSNAITLANQVQLVLRFQGEADQIHKNFDYLHCTAYWKSWDKELCYTKETLRCIMNKELKYQGSLFPLCAGIRTRKFITRGWTINAGQFVKIYFQIHKLDLTNPSVLEEQLVGVDSSYFSALIQDLKEQPDPKKVDEGYLMTLLDKVFG